MSPRPFSAVTPTVLVAAAASLALPVACAQDQEAEYPPGTVQYQGSYGTGAQPGSAGQAPYGYAGQSPYGQQGTYGQGGTPSTFPPSGGAPPVGAAGAPTTTAGSGGGGSVTPIDPAAAAVVQPVMNQLAAQHTVAGAKPVGSLLAGNFSTGGKLEAQVQLQPGKCYTVVASSLPLVTEVNVRFVAVSPIPGLQQVIATDTGTGASAVLGPKPNCFKWAFPVAAPVKLVLEVAGGSGLAAAQVYEK